MSDILEHAALNIAPPMAYSAAVPLSGQFRRASVTTAERIAIPAHWFGRMCTVLAQVQDITVVFGTSGVVAVTTVSSVSAEAVTFVAGTGFPFPAGVPMTFRLPPAGLMTVGASPTACLTHFSHIAGGTDGFLNIYVSENR